MKVVPVSREESLTKISKDTRVADILGELVRHPPLISFLIGVIRWFHSYQELVNGRAGGDVTLRAFVAGRQGKRDRAGAQRIATNVEGLYRDNPGGEGRVRGALLESLVEMKLRPRYSGIDCLLDNNLRFELVNGQTYASGTRSIDVIGFDGRVGECHDCKVHASRFEQPWIEDLTLNVAPRGFKIGLVTATHRGNAERQLREAGVSTRGATLIPADELHLLTPLQP